MNNLYECPTCGGPKPCKKCNASADDSSSEIDGGKNEALKSTETILHKALELGIKQIVKIGFNSNLQNLNFKPTPTELQTYSTFQQQTGLTITIDDMSITDQQFDKIEKNAASKKSIDKISVLFSNASPGSEQSGGTEKPQKTSSSTPFNTNPFKTRPSP